MSNIIWFLLGMLSGWVSVLILFVFAACKISAEADKRMEDIENDGL